MENSKIMKVKEFLKKRKIAVIVILILLLAGIAAGVGIAVHNSGESGEGGGADETTAAETTAAATESETDVDSTVVETETGTETEAETEGVTETEKEEATIAPETDAPATDAPATQVPEPTYVGVTSVALDCTELSLTLGQSVQPIVTMAPANANNKGEIWTSNNTRVASVDQEGNITATRAGECVITVNSSDNVQASASVKVTVTDPTAQETQAVETTSAEESPKIVQPADVKTGISWDGKSPIIYTYADGTTGTEPQVGASYEYFPGDYATVSEMQMPDFVPIEYDPVCSYCGKIKGYGTEGTCVRYGLVDKDMPCPSCGENIPKRECHTCK